MELNPDSKAAATNNTQVHSISQSRNLSTTHPRNTPLATEEAKHSRISYQRLIVLDQAVMYQKLLLTLQSTTISQDGLCPRLEELMRIREDLIETKRSTPDQLSEASQYQKIELDKNAISDPVIELKHKS